MKQKLSNLFSKSEIDTKTYNGLPPLHKEAVNDFFKLCNNEDGNIVDNVEDAVNKVAEFHNINTSVIYNYIDKEVETQLGEV